MRPDMMAESVSDEGPNINADNKYGVFRSHTRFQQRRARTNDVGV
jgi:hypothetical protein